MSGAANWEGVEFMQELIRLAPALRESGVLKLGCGDKWVELAPASVSFDPQGARQDDKEEEEEGLDPLFNPAIKLRAYDAPGSPK